MRQWVAMAYDDEPGRDRPEVHDTGGAPICPWCGVTALPASAIGRLDATFVCDEADCPGVGRSVGDGA